MLAILDDHPDEALAAFAAEDPLGLVARAAEAADDEGLLLDPGDLMIDAYVELTRARKHVVALEPWLEQRFPQLVAAFGRDPLGPALTRALARALGLDDDRVERWADAFRALDVHDRRAVLALVRAGSQSFRAVYPGRAFDLRRDLVEVPLAYSVLRALLSAALG